MLSPAAVVCLPWGARLFGGPIAPLPSLAREVAAWVVGEPVGLPGGDSRTSRGLAKQAAKNKVDETAQARERMEQLVEADAATTRGALRSRRQESGLSQCSDGAADRLTSTTGVPAGELALRTVTPLWTLERHDLPSTCPCVSFTGAATAGRRGSRHG